MLETGWGWVRRQATTHCGACPSLNPRVCCGRVWTQVDHCIIYFHLLLHKSEN